MELRIGHGYDVHALAPGESLWLGGVRIEYHLGTVAHSDGDVLIHAVCDAMLGALALRDIGFHFPDTDAAYKNADSKVLLEKVYQLILGKGYQLVNLDSTLCAQKPKLNPFIPAMQECLASILRVETGAVSIKATTTEKLGFVGREEGLEAHAVVLLKKNL